MKPLRQSIQVEMPDGTKRRVKLPHASKIRIGGKGNIAITYRGHLFIFWLTRVQGGWEPAERSGITHGIAPEVR